MRIQNVYICFEDFVDIFCVAEGGGGQCKTVQVLRVSLMHFRVFS